MSGIQFYEEQTRFKSERNEVKEINENIVKVGSVYILTEEEYNHLCKMSWFINGYVRYI